jgi:hypothetical protein
LLTERDQAMTELESALAIAAQQPVYFE